MTGSGLPNDTSVIFFMDQNTVFNKKGADRYHREAKNEDKAGNQQKENDGALMTSQLLKVRGRVWTSRNGRGPCVSQTIEVIRLIWPITWNDSSCCLCDMCCG